MDNSQYYYDRNHYFHGKLMTVRDFENEQNYTIAKRLMANRMLEGPGIVSGMNVILIDNKSFSLEAGLAIDYKGHEIFVPEAIVKELSVIEGFEENADKDELYLCIAYDEKFTESTFSVVGSGKGSGVSQEYNRVHERYKLFLTGDAPDEKELSFDHLVANRVTVYEKYGIKIMLEVPKYVNPGNPMKVTLLFEKNNVASRINYRFALSGDLFKSQTGESELEISYNENEVSAYKKVRKDYYMFCDATTDALTDLVIKGGSFSIEIDKELDICSEDIKQPIKITNSLVRDLIVDDYYTTPFEDVTAVKEKQEIYLAKFNIVHSQASYFVEEFKKHPFKQYILSNAMLDILQKNNYINAVEDHADGPKAIVALDEEGAKKRTDLGQVPLSNQSVISGVERINLGFYAKTGKVFFSYEFVHGLGYGNVSVVAAIDNKESFDTGEPSLLMFGDNSLFHKEGSTISVPKVSLGAVVDPNKGTLKLGVRLLEKTTVQFVDVRWWAFKADNEATQREPLSEEEQVKVDVVPSTVQIEPLAQTRLTVEVTGTSAIEVTWSVEENGGGTIDGNGLYTAPAKEGVYEVRATNVKYAKKYGVAYIVVSTVE